MLVKLNIDKATLQHGKTKGLLLSLIKERLYSVCLDFELYNIKTYREIKREENPDTLGYQIMLDVEIEIKKEWINLRDIKERLKIGL